MSEPRLDPPAPMDGSAEAAPTPASSPPLPGGAPTRYRVRRVPRLRAFLATGAVLGFLLGVLVDRLGPDDPRVAAGSSLAFLGLVGACLGVLLAAVVAVLVERRG